MNIMTGYLSATEGRVRIDGYDIFEEPDKAKRLLGYLPEQSPLYMNETPREYLRFVGEAKGLKGRDLIRQLGQEHTVILSSHILSEVQMLCEKVLIIAKGKLVAFDAPEELEKLFQASYGVSFVAEAEADEVDEILREMDGVSGWQLTALTDGRTRADVQTASGEAADLCRTLFHVFAGKEKALLELTSKKANLEDVFIELTESDSPAEPAEKESEEKEDKDV